MACFENNTNIYVVHVTLIYYQFLTHLINYFINSVFRQLGKVTQFDWLSAISRDLWIDHRTMFSDYVTYVGLSVDVSVMLFCHTSFTLLIHSWIKTNVQAVHIWWLINYRASCPNTSIAQSLHTITLNKTYQREGSC